MIKLAALVACTVTGISTLAPAQQDRALQALDQLRIPLHSAPADPQGGEYGLWAAGPGYKASFHDGFSFYPYRGPDQPLVRLHWRTESVTLGGSELLAAAPSSSVTDWRYELRYGSVSEVYDILAEGVEQSFVLHRPIGTGDLVITGRIGGSLTATPVDAAWQALEFADGGRAAVRYGKAVAFDASGARTTVETEYDGSRVRLTLAREFLDRAAFPVVVDPLTAPVNLTSLPSGTVAHSAMAVDNGSTTGKAMVVFTRQFAAGNSDAYGLLCNRDFGSPTVVWSEITTAWSTEEVDVAHVEGANRFAVVVQRDLSAATRQVRVYLHGDTNTTLNSGPTVALFGPAGTRRQHPQIGGARGIGANALVVFEEEASTIGSSAGTRVLAVRINAITGALTSAHDLHVIPASGVDSEQPAVVSTTSDNNGWVTIWRDRNVSSGRYFIRIANVDRFGTPRRIDQILSTPDPVSHLAVGGSWTTNFQGRYAAAWVQSSPSRRALMVRRFNQAGSTPPAFYPVRTVASSSLDFYGDVDIAHDWITLSHWAVTYTRTTPLIGTRANIVRLGYTGGTTESRTMAPTSSRPSGLGVAYAEGLGKGTFPATYGVGAASLLVGGLRGTVLSYPLDALSTTYGSICQPGVSISSNLPFAGHEFFRVEASPVAVNDFVYFLIGFAPTSVPLARYGFPPTCNLSVDPNGALATAFLNTDPSGRAVLQIALPDAPVLIGDVFIQAIVFPGGGTTPFVTLGLGVQVR